MTQPKTQQLAIIAYGLDSTGKAQAGRFTASQRAAATQAANALKLKVREVDADLADLAKSIPAGRLHARGRAFVPYVKRELYDQLAGSSDVKTDAETPEKSPLEISLESARREMEAALPKSWDEIGPGHLVLIQEALYDGWWEAVVVARKNETLSLRLRDFKKYQTFERNVRAVALVYSGL